MHSSTRQHIVGAAVSAVSLGLLATGCAGGDTGFGQAAATGDQEVLLQPLAAQGPDPFTQSTAQSSAPLPSRTTTAPARTASATPSAAGVPRISGGTPGLYGGTQSISSCNVEQQVRYLTGSGADSAKARAFADASGIEPVEIPDFLRALTPVVLRVDTRVTNHGFSNGSGTSFQSVLQAGTAVMVDSSGMPRVRCACGNPLLPPTVSKGQVSHKGKPWSGYRPTGVVVITPAPVVINHLTIVNVVNNTWIERARGTDGDNDRAPDPDRKLPPPPGPDDLGHDGRTTPPDGDRDQEPDTDGSTTPGASESVTGTPSDGGSDPGSTAPDDPSTDTSSPVASGTDPRTETSASQEQSRDPAESTTAETGSGTAPPPTTPCPSLVPGAAGTGAASPVPAGCPTPTPPPGPGRGPGAHPGPDGD